MNSIVPNKTRTRNRSDKFEMNGIGSLYTNVHDDDNSSYDSIAFRDALVKLGQMYRTLPQDTIDLILAVADNPHSGRN